MNSLANWGPWLEMIFFGMPKKGNTFSLYKSATWGDVRVTEVGIAMTIFEKWSTMFRIMSWSFETGKGPTRSTEITSQVLRRAEQLSSVDQSISISTHRYEPQLESVYHAPIWTATGIHCVINMSDHKDFGEAEPWSQDGDLRLESEVREETRCISLGQA